MGKVTLFLLCCFVAFLPFEMMAYFEDVPSGSKLLGIVIVGTGLLAFLTGYPIRLLSWPMVMRVVLVLYGCMSLGWSVAPNVTFSVIPRLALLLIFVLLVWEFAVAYKDQVWILRSLLVGMLIPLAMAFAKFRGASAFMEGEQRFGGGGQDLNYLAYMYCVTILIAVYLATNFLPLDRYCRWFYWGVAVLCALGTVLTGSRGGFACLVIAGLFTMVLAGVARRRIITIVQVLALAAFVYVLVRYIIPSAVLNRVTTAGETIWEDPRMRIWGEGMTAFWQNPLFGLGTGAYASAYAAATGLHGRVAHNLFISVLVELGIVGLAIYVAYSIMLFRAAWRLPRREKFLWLGVLVVWFINSNTAGSQIDKFSWFVHVMVLVQAAAYAQTRPVRRTFPYASRAVPVVRRPMPPRLGRP